jgi:hypothetical protein
MPFQRPSKSYIVAMLWQRNIAKKESRPVVIKINEFNELNSFSNKF